jgi:hypothetical protein
VSATQALHATLEPLRIGNRVAWVLCCFVIAACGGGGGTANAAPTVAFVEPDQAVQLGLGAPLQITYRDDDPDSVATTTLYADIDGDLATTNDQVVIAVDRPDQDGAEQTITWDTTGAPSGVYGLYAVATDGVTTVQADAGVAITLGTGNVPPTVSLGPEEDMSPSARGSTSRSPTSTTIRTTSRRRRSSRTPTATRRTA